MNPNSPPFSWENGPFSPSQTECLMALLGPSPEQTEIPFFDPTTFDFNLDNFLGEQYPPQSGLPPSPGIYPPQSLPSTPSSSADELFDVGVVEAFTPYNPDPSPGGLSVPVPLADLHNAKHTKPDLDNFTYDPAICKWVCTKCGGDFVTAHEARRHAKTAAKCTGKKVKCLRCGDLIHASGWSRRRHFTSKKCQKKGRRRGAPSFTVNTVYEEDEGF